MRRAGLHRGGAVPRATARVEAGFTLIELMIVVALVAILSSLAYASYQAQVVKARRATAAACLMGQVQYMERYYTSRFSYAGATVPTGGCVAELAGFYSFSGSIQASAYTLSAVPRGAQAAGDSRCMTLTITDTGLKGETGTADRAEECW